MHAMKTTSENFWQMKADRQGFTLMELLVVVSVMLVIMGLGVPLATGLMGPMNFNSSVARVSNLIDQARQYAVTQNTHVWVAFHQSGAGGGGRGLERVAVALIASEDGTNPLNWSQTVVLPADGLQMIHKLEWALATRIETRAAVESFVRVGTSPRETGEPLAGSLIFRIRNPEGGAMLEFDQVILFTPRGEALVGEAPVGFADLVLQPVRGAGRADQANFAIIQVNALTGFSRVYRQ